MTRSRVGRAATIGGLTAAAGFVAAAVFTLISGIQYRMAEDRGLPPGYAPDWIVAGTEAGLLLIVLGAAIALGSLVAMLLVDRGRRQEPRNAAPPSGAQGPPA